jgi:AraC-like DNA-binding protein
MMPSDLNETTRLSPAGTFIAVAPPPDLTPFVEFLWQFTVAAATPALSLIRSVPGGQADIALGSLDPDLVTTETWGPSISTDGPPLLCGFTTSSHAIPLAAGTTVAGVRLRVGAGFRVFRLALGTVARASRTLRDIVGLRRTNALRSAVLTSLRSTRSRYSTPDGLGAALAAARSLIGSADLDRPVDPRLKRAVVLIDESAISTRDGSGRAAIDETARAVAMSPRTLERLFHDHIGLTPRTFMRLRRVCAVAARLEAPVTFLGCSNGGRLTLSHLAHHVGFADHAHLTRDFRRAMGVTPSEYAREARERPIIREWRGVRPELLTPLGRLAVGVGPAAEQAG